ncbi:helix-turn-helix transcriptional regulator [Neobacillus sp. MM2021_6]|uniref:helix-turn-helix domain-containing protein n=1 Tax=Bacillaceae TaxID=186817 RepID=UPI0014094C21|nr:MULTISPECIES: helix-turn-helix transcriptional regulator [Bacillaceae]MBO0959940.1 helix-turn-helix transcriptional regulator [Neobacillus sp. MM2021_6]NHC18889.1 helix-turn-helix transcriptional regulator [Bacillus sp. MM2020_4]
MHHKILIGAVIKRNRLIHKISQAELAERSSLSQITISKCERNISEPSFETIIKLSQAFKMNVSEFVSEIEESVRLTSNLDEPMAHYP